MTIAQQLKIKDFPFEIRDMRNGKVIYREDSTGYSERWQYDSDGNQIWHESSYGAIKDTRPKAVELTMQEIADNFGIDINLLTIKP